MEYLVPTDLARPLLLSLRVAGIATALSFLAALFVAWRLARRRGPLPSLLNALCTLPLVLPPTVLGYYLILVVGRNGLLGPALRDLGLQLIFSWQGAVVAATVVVFPLLYKSARAALEQVDPHLENAARTLGASELRILLTVSLPLAWKGIFAGLMLAFARGMGEFGATLMVAGNIPGKTQTLALAIYDAFQAGNDALATLLVLVTSGLCVTLLMAAEMPEDSRTLVLFGASGSGKTLTLHCLAGLVRPDAGRIVVDGNVLYDSEQGICVLARRRRIGYMFQDYALFPHLSVLHNVAYAGTGLLPWRLNREQRAWAMDLLERLGIAHLARLYPGNLSGGQKQRVALARALGTRPSLLLLDEPFSALDPLLRERLRGEIQEILAAFAIPAVIISHDPEDVDAFAGTLVTYHRGRARMIADYASLRREYASAGDCLRHLQQEMQAESARAAGR